MDRSSYLKRTELFCLYLVLKQHGIYCFKLNYYGSLTVFHKEYLSQKLLVKIMAILGAADLTIDQSNYRQLLESRTLY